ncbi:MAG: DUF4957 domain-containing protein [Bacteroidales bacterium]|jgi:hypothetical protein|nr:DUF4957 domain-containing protein [Bacteroidales bacterium]
MKKQLIKTGIMLGLSAGLFLTACDDIDPVVDSLNFNRYLAPVGIEASLSKIVELTLTWTAVPNASSYYVEIYKDSLQFDEANLIYRENVSTNRLQYSPLIGDTHYSARIKIAAGVKEESKWNWIVFQTSVDSKFLTAEAGDIGSDYAIFRWPAGMSATKISLTPTSGAKITQELNAQEIAEGKVQVEGLQPSMKYTATLYDDNWRVGLTDVTTLKAGTIIVRPEDDFRTLLETAADSTAFMLLPGDYISDGANIALTKSIFISGYGENLQPVIHCQFTIATPKVSLSLTNVEMNGIGASNSYSYFVQANSAEKAELGNIVVEGCRIKNYSRSLLAMGSSGNSSIESFTVNNSIIENIEASGGDFVDVRVGLIKKLTITNSTFNKCAWARCFLRMDDPAANFPGQKTEVLIDRCTFYGVTDVETGQSLLHVRVKESAVKMTNCIVAKTKGTLAHSKDDMTPECGGNNYFDAPNFLSATANTTAISPDAKFDSSAATRLDPEFADADNGDFTVTNANVKVGDPRWF